MILRPATPEDGPFLLRLRNDRLTRENSLSDTLVGLEEHWDWLASSLVNPNRRLWIAEVDGERVGTIREDLGPLTELSWTVAPEARGQGYGTAMLQALTATVSGPLKALIKARNAPSRSMALRAGFRPGGARNGVREYSWNPEIGSSEHDNSEGE